MSHHDAEHAQNNKTLYITFYTQIWDTIIWRPGGVGWRGQPRTLKSKKNLPRLFRPK